MSTNPTTHPPTILSRSVSETVIVGDDITITVLGIKGNTARIMITAPNGTRIVKEEFYEASSVDN